MRSRGNEISISIGVHDSPGMAKTADNFFPGSKKFSIPRGKITSDKISFMTRPSVDVGNITEPSKSPKRGIFRGNTTLLTQLAPQNLDLVTPEEREKFMKNIRDARAKVVFPDNPSLFPESIRI